MVRVGVYLDTPRDPLPAGLCSPPSSEDKGEVASATSHVGPLPHALVAPEVTASTVSSAYWRIRTGLASPWWAPGSLHVRHGDHESCIITSCSVDRTHIVPQKKFVVVARRRCGVDFTWKWSRAWTAFLVM